MLFLICSATVPSRVNVKAQPSWPPAARSRTTTNSRCFMIQSPNTTGAGSCPWIVATLTSVIVEGDGIGLGSAQPGRHSHTTIEAARYLVNRLAELRSND